MLYDTNHVDTTSDTPFSGSEKFVPQKTITASLVEEGDRLGFLFKMIGNDVASIQFESYVYSLMSKLSSHQYLGGYWDFLSLSNGGFYMRLQGDATYTITSPNGHEYECSVETASVVVNLFALNWMTARKGLDKASIEAFSTHYYHLRDFALEHKDASLILDLID